MSELPADALDYRTVVAEYFLALRGAGLMLSPLDQDAVAEWERRGVPVAVVCRGLRRGAEDLAARRAGRPRSLRALRLAVEDEWRAYRHGRVGEAPPPPEDEEPAARARLEAARGIVVAAGAAAAPEQRDAWRAAWRALCMADANRGSPLERVEAALACADACLLASWLRALPPAARRTLGPRVRLRAGARAAGASRRAYRGALLSHLSDLAREAGLTCLRGTV